ncbi:MAG: hypothetical protein WBD27_06980 [Pyrinomonadaceae bacterium]
MMNRLKLSIVLAPLALFLVIGAYVYSLWSVERKKASYLPVEAVSMMMRDLLRFHEKRGGFPETLKNLEVVVWEKKPRDFSLEGRALSHGNYYYFYTRISDHQFTLWAIPTGKARDEAPTWFLAATQNVCKRWKGAALPFEHIEQIVANPSLKELGAFGLIEQPQIQLESRH